MKILNKTIEFKTKKLFDLIDITDQVIDFIKETEIKDGLINIQLLNTTTGLIVNENEPLLIEDFKKNLEKSAPMYLGYKHDNFEERTVNICDNECVNGHSHCKAIHLLMNACLNLIKGEMQLGQWQRVLVVELDSSRERKVQIQVIGN
ncbi:MAG: secondary thiamine-phosphate synthase enzyme YjbQ [Candidatus Nealsonbacteria bacterium]